jgi:RNA polymerase subunit RPABC4/transcription elongation factor Spt4
MILTPDKPECPDCGETERIAEGTECPNCGHVFPESDDGCPECGGHMEQQTSIPLTYMGKCEVYLVCEECNHAVLVGNDSVI